LGRADLLLPLALRECQRDLVMRDRKLSRNKPDGRSGQRPVLHAVPFGRREFGPSNGMGHGHYAAQELRGKLRDWFLRHCRVPWDKPARRLFERPDLRSMSLRC